MSQERVIVVGGGVVGASSAWWLDRSGFDVVVLERRDSFGSVTTPNALGTIRTQYGTRVLIDLAQESLSFYRNVTEHLGIEPWALGWANHGYLYLSDNEEHTSRLQASLAEYQSMGVTSSSFVGESEIRDRFPFAGSAVAGIFHGDGSWVDPRRITQAWVDASPAVDWRTGVEVTAISSTSSGAWELETSQGALTADRVVICSGPYAPAMLQQFGVTVPVKITPRYKLFVPDMDEVHAAAPLVININNGAYWRPVDGGVWLSHSNVDGRSLEPADTVAVPDGFLDDCADQIEPVSPALAAAARARRDDVTYAGGFQVYPADDAPIVGEVPGAAGLYMNTGHWAGVMLSPACGRLLADCVAGTVDDGANPCRIGRFADGSAERHGTNKFGGWG